MNLTTNTFRPTPDFTLHRIAIFGAAHGIGEAVAISLETQTGLHIYIDRDPSFLDERVLNPLAGCYRLRADVTEKAQLEAGLKGIHAKSLDGVFLSAGIQDDAQPELTFRVNVEGTKNCFEAVTPYLKHGALVVFLSSDRITFEAPSESAYVQSKRAIAEFALDLAKIRDDLRILILLPGPVDTALFRKNKSAEVLRAIEDGPGILSPVEFSRMLLQDVIPQSRSHPSGAAVRMYKKSGIEWLSSIDA